MTKAVQEPFSVTYPDTVEIPIVLSVPHSGVAFPEDMLDEYESSLTESPDDTDWFVDRLYDFGPSIGMTMISATYSRWVIDLNRDPQSKPLYSDGRIITSLCPTTDFLGTPLYKDKRSEIDAREVQRRVDYYYRPYHDRLQQLLDEKKGKFGAVLLWDCHSIRQSVHTIHAEKFPDLILGDADGTSASPGLIDTTIRELEESKYSFQHNYPFKGGFITRHYGRPSEFQHALQLEMTKINYMDDREVSYAENRADQMRILLKKVFGALESVLQP